MNFQSFIYLSDFILFIYVIQDAPKHGEGFDKEWTFVVGNESPPQQCPAKESSPASQGQNLYPEVPENTMSKFSVINSTVCTNISDRIMSMYKLFTCVN